MAGELNQGVRDASAWRAGSFADPDAYTIELSEADRGQLRGCVAAVEAAGRLEPITALKGADFDLGALGEKLLSGFAKVKSGPGLVLIRGIPHDGWTMQEYSAAVWGIATCFGHTLSQNAQGELISQVVDATAEDSTPRMYRSNAELGLHNDPTAMLSLACWNPARRGGISVFASAVTVHDEIRKRAPHLLPHLYRGFHYHRLGEEGPDQEPVTPYRVPIFSVINGQVSCRNARAGYIAGHHALNIPISDAEIEAIDLFDEIARERDNHLVIPLQRGDMVVINNYTVLHARTAFEDHAEAGKRRTLIRLWLDADGFRAVPKEFNQFGGSNGIPPQSGRRCTYDFKKLFREARPELLGRKHRMTLAELVDSAPR